MARYLISDLHFDHANIIRYCDRPFTNVDEMNNTLIKNWNTTVEPTDTVVYLGDFGWWGVDNIISFYERLNGEMLLVRGNHDEFDAADVPFSVVESCTLSYQGYEFYCEHQPLDVPTDANWWHLHGDTHNNHLDEYPFVAPTENRVNVSCEVVRYTPLALDELITYIKRGERLRLRPQ